MTNLWPDCGSDLASSGGPPKSHMWRRINLSGAIMPSGINLAKPYCLQHHIHPVKGLFGFINVCDRTCCVYNTLFDFSFFFGRVKSFY